MADDIRFSVNFWQHPKTVKLSRKGGLEAVRSLQILWCFCAQERTDGILSGMDGDDIEIAADWQGDPGKLLDLLLAGNWLERFEDGTYALHGWEERQAYVSKADSRKAQAKAAAETRWRKKRGMPEHMPDDAPAYADSCNQHCPSQNEHMLTHAQRNAPDPDPIPDPDLNPTHTIDIFKYKDARVAQSVPEGGEGEEYLEPAGVDENTPGIEFQELRAVYNAQGRVEAPLAGLPEYLALKKSRQWPGQSTIYDAIYRLSMQDSQWIAGKAPGLGKFLKEQWWRMKPRPARASPLPPPGTGGLAERNMATAKQVIAALEAENGK